MKNKKEEMVQCHLPVDLSISTSTLLAMACDALWNTQAGRSNDHTDPVDKPRRTAACIIYIIIKHLMRPENFHFAAYTNRIVMHCVTVPKDMRRS